MKHDIKKGCFVRWRKDYIDNPEYWWATRTEAVKVKEVEACTDNTWQGRKIIHFETPIEITFAGETTSVFEHYLEHACPQITVHYKNDLLTNQNQKP